MGHHGGYVQQGPNSNRAVTIKQRKLIFIVKVINNGNYVDLIIGL